MSLVMDQMALLCTMISVQSFVFLAVASNLTKFLTSKLYHMTIKTDSIYIVYTNMYCIRLLINLRITLK